MRRREEDLRAARIEISARRATGAGADAMHVGPIDLHRVDLVARIVGTRRLINETCAVGRKVGLGIFAAAGQLADIGEVRLSLHLEPTDGTLGVRSRFLQWCKKQDLTPANERQRRQRCRNHHVLTHRLRLLNQTRDVRADAAPTPLHLPAKPKSQCHGGTPVRQTYRISTCDRRERIPMRSFASTSTC